MPNWDKQQEDFLTILFDDEIGGDPMLAKKMAGYSDRYPLHKVIDTLKDEIVKRTKTYIAVNGPKAAMKLVGVLDKPSGSEAKNIIAASTQILDRAGVIKEETLQVQSDGPVSVIIIPAKTQIQKTE